MPARTGYTEYLTFEGLVLDYDKALSLLQHARDHVGRQFMYDYYSHGEYAAAMVTLFECSRWVGEVRAERSAFAAGNQEVSP